MFCNGLLFVFGFFCVVVIERWLVWEFEGLLLLFLLLLVLFLVFFLIVVLLLVIILVLVLILNNKGFFNLFFWELVLFLIREVILFFDRGIGNVLIFFDDLVIDVGRFVVEFIGKFVRVSSFFFLFDCFEEWFVFVLFIFDEDNNILVLEDKGFKGGLSGFVSEVFLVFWDMFVLIFKELLIFLGVVEFLEVFFLFFLEILEIFEVVIFGKFFEIEKLLGNDWVLGRWLIIFFIDVVLIFIGGFEGVFMVYFDEIERKKKWKERKEINIRELSKRIEIDIICCM